MSKSTALKIITDTNQSNSQHQEVRVEAGEVFLFCFVFPSLCYSHRSSYVNSKPLLEILGLYIQDF